MPCVTLPNASNTNDSQVRVKDDPTKPAARFAYSFEQGPAHFIMVNTELDIDGEKFPQFQWLEQDLRSINRTITPWVVVMGHRPMWPRAAPKEGRSYEDLLYQYQVDVTVAGHVHYAQYSCPVYKGKCITPNITGGYDAPVHIVAGNGGQTLNNASHRSKTLPYTGSGCDWNSNTSKCGYHHPAAGQSSTQGSGSEMGISAFTINATDLVWEFIGNNDSKTHHTLQITRVYPRPPHRPARGW